MSDTSDGRGWVRFFAPATVANVGPGYDCFGFALDHPGDTVLARIGTTPGVRLIEVRGDNGELPTEPSLNTASRAAQSIWDVPQLEGVGLELMVEKGLPLCSGLGSSAASAVAGALAAMTLRCEVTGERYDEAALLEAALDGEELAAGSRHADNVAPAVLGGFTVVQSNAPLRVARLEPALKLWVAAVTPELKISTREAREALPEQVPLRDAVINGSNAAALVVALIQGDVELLGHALRDVIVEPCRAKLIPGFAACRAAALDAGALACSISGSGPTLFALAREQQQAATAGQAMAQAFAAQNLHSQTVVARLSHRGASKR